MKTPITGAFKYPENYEKDWRFFYIDNIQAQVYLTGYTKDRFTTYLKQRTLKTKDGHRVAHGRFWKMFQKHASDGTAQPISMELFYELCRTEQRELGIYR